MLYREEECSERVTIKAKPGIVTKANEVYRANHPFAKRIDFDELFEQLVTLAAIQLGLITNTDLGITDQEFKALQPLPEKEESENIQKPEINDTLEVESGALNLLN